MGVTVITNNQPRELLFYSELTDKEQEKVERGIDSTDDYVRYKGEVYHLNDFMVAPTLIQSEKHKWDGIITDTFFSGILMRFSPDGEHVVMGRYYE